MSQDTQSLDPNRLSAAQLAKLLSAAARVRIPAEQIQEDVEDGAPQNTDGTLSLIPYVAWLVKEMGRGD